MARAIERIEKDINDLKEAIRAIAYELNLAYARYINILGSALQKQLILASYYLCTQGYPAKRLD
jgi:prefoldin subunit 5